MSDSDQTRRQQLVRIAFELKAKDDHAVPEVDFAAAVQDAALEMGMDPAYLEKAEAELKRRELEAAEAQQRRKANTRRGAMIAAAMIAVAAVGWGVKGLLFPPAPAPYSDGIEVPGRWSLDTNPGTRAQLRFEQEVGRGGVAVVSVESFAVGTDGQFRANLDGLGVPTSFRGYSDLVVDLRGTLKTARVYVEAGPEQRWRSPPITVAETWGEHRLPLKAFERQVREGGKWKTVGWAAPDDVTQVSLKVGQFMNGPDAAGEVRVDRVRLE
jgi:hypothetical protein